MGHSCETDLSYTFANLKADTIKFSRRAFRDILPIRREGDRFGIRRRTGRVTERIS